MVIGGLPVLTKSNYKLWATEIERFLKDYGLWDVIEPTVGVAVEERRMYTALGCICQTLPEDILVQVGVLMDAKKVWRALKIRFLGIDHVRKEEEEKAAQEAAEKERLEEIAEKERLDAIVQEEQARETKVREAAEKEEALQALIDSEEKERLDKEKERIYLEEEEKRVNLQVCFANSNNLEDKETVKINEQERSKEPVNDHEDERKDVVVNERKDALNRSAYLEPYVKINNQTFVEETIEPVEKFRRIVRKNNPTWFGKERKKNVDSQECLDGQQKKRQVRKKNVDYEDVSEMNTDGLNEKREKLVKQVCYKQLKRKGKERPMIGTEELRVLLGIQDLGGTIQD